MLYKHLNTGAVAELIRSGGIVELRIVESNEIREISEATFKRWWKPFAPESEDAIRSPLDASDETEAEGPGIDRPEAENATTEAVDDQNTTLALSEIISKLENLFHILNDLYFEKALPQPVITVQSTPRAYGHCSNKKIWHSGVEGEGEAYYEINIGAEYLNRSSEQTAATLTHEMIHLFCRENELEETCQNGRYHNKFFKEEAEKRDLAVGYSRANGFFDTQPTEAFAEKLRTAGFVLEVPFARHTIEKGRAKSARAKAIKYFCPGCGQTVKSTADLNLICGNCEIPMERAE